jgi:cobalt-zinc-cadmium efflux system protein
MVNHHHAQVGITTAIRTHRDFGRAFAIGLPQRRDRGGPVRVRSAVELVALISDAATTCPMCLGSSWRGFAAHTRQAAPSARFTYGLRGSSILAALFNAVFLLVAMGALSWRPFGVSRSRAVAAEPSSSWRRSAWC